MALRTAGAGRSSLTRNAARQAAASCTAMYAAAETGSIRRLSARPIVTAGFRWPPEMVIVAVIITESTTAWARAIPISPIPLLGKPPFTTTTAAPTNTNPKVPKASALNRRVSDGMRESRSVLDPPEEEAGVDAAESERVAEEVVRLQRHSVGIDGGQVAHRIGAVQVDRRWDPTTVTGQGTDRCLDRATRSQCVTVVTLGPAERRPVGVRPEDLLDG